MYRALTQFSSDLVEHDLDAYLDGSVCTQKRASNLKVFVPETRFVVGPVLQRSGVLRVECLEQTAVLGQTAMSRPVVCEVLSVWPTHSNKSQATLDCLLVVDVLGTVRGIEVVGSFPQHELQ